MLGDNSGKFDMSVVRAKLLPAAISLIGPNQLSCGLNGGETAFVHLYLRLCMQIAKHNNKDIFYMRGHLGQMVIVIPQDNVIIVRLGHRIEIPKDMSKDPHSPNFYTYIDEAYNMTQ